MTGSLEGHVAVVTDAGRGIGRAHALLMAERGAPVVVGRVNQAILASIASGGTLSDQ